MFQKQRVSLNWYITRLIILIVIDYDVLLVNK